MRYQFESMSKVNLQSPCGQFFLEIIPRFHREMDLRCAFPLFNRAHRVIKSHRFIYNALGSVANAFGKEERSPIKRKGAIRWFNSGCDCGGTVQKGYARHHKSKIYLV